MSKITSQIEQLKEWEKQFDSFLNEQRTLTQNYRQSTEQMEAEKVRLDTEINEAYEKQHSLNDEKNRDLQVRLFYNVYSVFSVQFHY